MTTKVTGSVLANTAVTAGTYGAANGAINTVITVDAQGRITTASNVAVAVANTRITGNIISSQITSVANTQITGLITAAQIASSAIPSSGQPQMSFASHPTTVFNSTGTPMVNTGTGTFNWTCPTGVTKVMVSVIAGGGGSNGGEGTQSGGTGGTAVGIYTVVPGTVYAITVGAGGAGNGVNLNAGSGTSSSFSSFCSATGGVGTNSSGISSKGTGSSGNIKNSGTQSYVGTHIGFLGNADPVNLDTFSAPATSWSTSTYSPPGSGGAGAGASGGMSGIVLITWVG